MVSDRQCAVERGCLAGRTLRARVDRDGNVSTFDVNSRYSQNEVLISAPIRDEEFQRQRPLAIAPDGDLVAMGSPLERNTPNSARIYFFKRSDNKRILFTIDKLPSRPLELRFSADRDGKRLLLFALLADRQLTRVYDVTKVRDAATNPALQPGYSEFSLPEPIAGFAGACERRECNTFGIAFAPDNAAGIRVVIGSDSGIVLYDRNFAIAGYGFWKDDRPDFRRVAGISFSPDGKRVAIGRRPLEKEKNNENRSCQVDVYDFDAFIKTSADKRLTAKPIQTLSPPQYRGLEVCYFSHVVWAKDAIFAVGQFVAAPAPGQPCRTFKDLEPDYDPYAMLMVRWANGTNAVSVHCLGTNTAADLQPFPEGGVVTVTQDPAMIVFDANGAVSNYPAQPDMPRRFNGDVFDFRDASRGDMSVNADGSIVYLRPLTAPRAYVAFDVTAPPNMNPYAANLTREGLLRELKDHRTDTIAFGTLPEKGPETCLGVSAPKLRDPITLYTTDPLTAGLRDVLKFRPTETVRSYRYLPPAGDGKNWRVVLGTSHRLLYADCGGRDLWNNQNIADLPFPGVSIRNDAYQLVVSGDQRFLIVAHADGLLRWYRTSNGQNILNAYLHPDHQSWIAWTPEGFFDRSNSTGSRRAGWFQSTPGANGTWSAHFEGLSRHQDKWRKPDELIKALSDEKYDSSLAIIRETPDSGRPDVALQILNGNSTADTTVRVRIQTSKFDDSKPLNLGIEGFGTIQIDLRRRKQGSGMQADGSFALPRCLQRSDKSWRIWAEYEGSRDNQYLVYKGTDSGLKECAKPKIWGLVVGISKYDRVSLKFAHQDAERFFNFWKDQRFYEVGRLTMLLAPDSGNAQRVEVAGTGAPKTTNIADTGYETVDEFFRSELKTIKAGIQKDDILLVYFAGHGMSTRERWYFLPSNGDPANPKDTAFNIDQFRGTLESFKFNPEIPILIFIDACRSFEALGEQLYSFQRTAERDFTQLVSVFNASVFLATGKGKAAYELPEKDLNQPTDPVACSPSDSTAPQPKGGGAFTHVLLSVLNGKGADPNGFIPSYRVEEHLKVDVRKICAKQEYQRFDLNGFNGFFGKE